MRLRSGLIDGHVASFTFFTGFCSKCTTDISGGDPSAMRQATTAQNLPVKQHWVVELHHKANTSRRGMLWLCERRQPIGLAIPDRLCRIPRRIDRA
jgi:hypothetical protein